MERGPSCEKQEREESALSFGLEKKKEERLGRGGNIVRERLQGR